MISLIISLRLQVDAVKSTDRGRQPSRRQRRWRGPDGLRSPLPTGSGRWLDRLGGEGGRALRATTIEVLWTWAFGPVVDRRRAAPRARASLAAEAAIVTPTSGVAVPTPPLMPALVL
jgi:hypothetical protein